MQARAMNGLTKTQVAEAIQTLETKRDELLREVEATNGLSIAAADLLKSDHPADTANTCTEQATYAALVKNAQVLFGLVCDSLRRIEQGSYGLCTDCQGKIPPERIAAMPHGLRCVSCQTKFENRTRRGQSKTPPHGLFG